MDNVFDYIQRLQADLIEQFRGKPNMATMSKALARQLQELYNFFLELRTTLNIEKSSGRQLDNIGDIVQLSRMEARDLASKSSYVYADEDAMYRIFLHYKIFLNTAECTYEDVMKSIHMLWDGNLTYQEDPSEPATIILNHEIFTGANDMQLLNIPILKPAGVKIRFRSHGNLGMQLYIGGSTTEMCKLKFSQTSPTELPLVLLDEAGHLLTDEAGCILYEGAI